VGWGTVAVHGQEGFRAQNAAVRCLLADPAPTPTALAAGVGSHLPKWRLRMEDEGRVRRLRRVSAVYGVPLVSMVNGLKWGLVAGNRSAGLPLADHTVVRPRQFN